MARRSPKRQMLLMGCLLSVAALVAPATSGIASAQGAPSADQSEARRFIVTLRDDVRDPAAVANEHAFRYGADVAYVYRHALRGYAATFVGGGLSDLARDARVVRVEPDGPVSASVTQTAPPWGLDRIDQRARSLTNTFTYTSTGAGVTAYVIDSGVRIDHEQFGGRASLGIDVIGGAGAGSDCNGHGTHVAGTVGGTRVGVAKQVSLVAVRVLDCGGSGSWAGVIKGIDYVTGDHLVRGGPAVANMSLGGGASASVDSAVANSIAKGVSYAVAAGNGNTGGVAQDACKYSPARVPGAMTVGATDKLDKKASWSNYGPCVDWFAPGVSIESSWIGSASAYNTISGTSMASPHTAGVAALYLATNPAATPGQVSTALFNAATTGAVASSRTVVNPRLLFTSY